MFGDIITDLAAAVTGGIGLAASGNLNISGTAPSMYEPVHGSAPDIAVPNRQILPRLSCRQLSCWNKKVMPMPQYGYKKPSGKILLHVIPRRVPPPRSAMRSHNRFKKGQSWNFGYNPIRTPYLMANAHKS